MTAPPSLLPHLGKGLARSPYPKVLKGSDCLGVKSLSLGNVLILEGRRNTLLEKAGVRRGTR